jgi:hypothetical protein
MAITIVMLTGGPSDLLQAYNTWEVDDLEEKIKIKYRSGYEHYTHNGTFRMIDGHQLPVFQWCDRTRMAE